MRKILVVGHGSRVPEAVAQFYRFVDALSIRVGESVSSCFLELVEPDMVAGLAAAAHDAGKGGEVVVLPLFLGAGGHQKNDVVTAIQWAREQFPEITFRYAAPLGPHALLVRLLAQRVEAALPREADSLAPEVTGVLVVGRGSSDPDSCSEVARSAYLLFHQRPYLFVDYAFQAAARPGLEEGIRRCQALGAKQVVVAPYLLFTGKVIEDIRRVTSRVGEQLGLPVIQAGYLDVHPLIIDVAEQRLHEAMIDAVSMNCSICKYREPVGNPVISA